MFNYTLKTGLSNLGAKKLFSFASIGTIACCVFVFCIFYSIVTNIKGMISEVESTIGIQVFFNEGMSEEQIVNIANEYFFKDYVKDIKYISSEEAWNEFKEEYFGDRKELASAFEDDNPLVNSSSFEILLYDIDKQYEYVDYLYTIEGVRQVNYSNVVIETLSSINFAVSSFSFVLIGILMIISIILISTTIAVASQFRHKENEIMKLIGATNFMIRAPFVMEGFLIGLFGSFIPIIVVCLSYNYVLSLVMTKSELVSNIFTPLPLSSFLLDMTLISISFSCIMCTVVSFFTVRKSLRV